VKVTVHGPLGAYGYPGAPNGIRSFGVDEVVEVPDSDKAAVAYLRTLAEAGAATIENGKPPAKGSPPADAPADADPS